MLENSTYSILSPEGFASILWKDSSRSDEAAEIMQLTPSDLLRKRVIEGIIPEQADHQQVTAEIRDVLSKRLKKLNEFSGAELLKRRQKRYRKF